LYYITTRQFKFSVHLAAKLHDIICCHKIHVAEIISVNDKP